MAIIQINRYKREDMAVWNEFVAAAKNATFLFDRNYMDYHAHRFEDHSILIFSEGRLRALFVANEEGRNIVSHGGLSYGGLVLPKEARLEEVLSYFYYLTKYYTDRGFREIIYKCLPTYLATFISEEDLYAMFLLQASLIRRETSSVIVKADALPYQQRRKSNVKRGYSSDYRIVSSADPSLFWEKVLIPNLNDRFGAEPVHSIDEISMLINRFPNNIQLYEIHTDEIVGGTVIYSTQTTAHAQYTSATVTGKELGALDFLFDELIQHVYAEKSFFSFGTSNGEPGGKLNRGLVNWKEGFGARTFTIDSYQIESAHYKLLAEYA